MKTDPRVGAYIAKSAEFARPVLRHLRALVHQACPVGEETIKWSVPFFFHQGNLCFIAAFKAHAIFGFWHREMKAFIREDGARGQTAMGSFGRITSRDDLPDDKTMLRYLRQAVKLNESGQPAHPRPAKPKKELPVPKELASALRKNKPAAAAFGKFSPSHRSEYIKWIAEAKREVTRQKRIATTMEWLAEGKPRNWQYMRTAAKKPRSR